MFIVTDLVSLRNKFDFWYVHEIMNTLGLLQFITYIYILYYQSSTNFQCSPYWDGFPNILK